MKQTIESRTAESVLQKQQNVIVGDQTYLVAPPSIATIILVSQAVAQLPHIKLNAENVITESLHIAKDCHALGDILAVLILGAKNLQSTTTAKTKQFFGLLTQCTEVTTDNQALLAKKILEELSPREVSEILAKLLSTMELSFFFGTTTSLTEINLLHQTRAIETTAFGQ